MSSIRPHTYKVGDKVRLVQKQHDLEPGTVVTVKHVYPDHFCLPGELFTDGSSWYVKHGAVELAGNDKVLDDLRKAIAKARGAGYDVSIAVTKTVTEKVDI